MKLLFITHNSKRGGAPKVLLLFLKWLLEKEDCIIDVLDLAPGEFSDDFKAVCKRYYELPRKYKKPKGLFKYIPKPQQVEGQLGTLLKHNNYDLIYANTVKAIPYGVLVKQQLSVPKLLVHVHELSLAIKLLLPDLLKYVEEIDRVVAVSKLVKQVLVEEFNFNQEKIEVVFPFSDYDLRNKIGGDSKPVFRIGASGHVDWRKGADVFIQVARSFFKQHPKAEVDFVWVGDVKATDRLILEADIAKLGLQGRVSFIGEQVNPSVYFSSFDVFLMCSREDPFPLVCIEVGQLGIPVICFENAVGTSEILQDGGGKVVPYLDIEAMTGEVITYFKEPSLCVEDGKQAKEVFQGFHVNQQAPKLMHIMNQLIS